MRDVVKHQADNKMDMHNICMMFAPNIFRNRNVDPLSELSLLTIKIDLCKLMMEEYDLLFEGV